MNSVGLSSLSHRVPGASTSSCGCQNAVVSRAVAARCRQGAVQGERNKLAAVSRWTDSCLPSYRRRCWEVWHGTQRKRETTMSLVAPDSHSILYGVLAACAAIGQIVESRTKWGARVSAPLLAMGVGMALSAAQILPSAAPTYESVFSALMPMAVGLSLLETDVASAFTDAGSTLKAFAFGSIGTILGTILGYWCIGRQLGSDGWKIASALCSSYVGGSINYAATAQALGLTSGSTLAAGMAADNLAMAVYFSIIMSIPDDSAKRAEGVEAAASDAAQKTDPQSTVETIAISIAAAALACTLGSAIASVLPPSFAGSGLAIMAVVASLFSAGGARVCGVTDGARVPLFAGSQTLGGALMLFFFSVIGASTNPIEAVRGGWALVVFILTIMLVHLAITLGLGRLARLPMRTLLVASNANIGGPATAAAMANARGWPGLVRPALVVGTFGYTIGTIVGCVVGVRLLQHML